MRTGFVVIFNPTRSEWPTAQNVLRAIGQAQLAQMPQKEFGYTLKFDSEADYERFVSEVESWRLSSSYFVRRERRISPRDLESPLVRVIVRTAPRGMGGPTYGTAYELSRACPRCGTAAKQVSPLYLRRRDAPRSANIWATLDDEILLAADVARSLGEVSGLELRQTRSAEDSGLLPWFQMLPTYELPPMATTTEAVIQNTKMACPACRRDGFFEGTIKNRVMLPSTIRYALDLDSLPDAMHTYERFGRSLLGTPFESSHFAAPLVIVRGHVFERLRNARARGLFAEPVDVLDIGRSTVIPN
jgi:hypothetical protein